MGSNNQTATVELTFFHNKMQQQPRGQFFKYEPSFAQHAVAGGIASLIATTSVIPAEKICKLPKHDWQIFCSYIPKFLARTWCSCSF